MAKGDPQGGRGQWGTVRAVLANEGLGDGLILGTI